MPQVRAQRLSRHQADRIVRVLAPYVSETRKRRIEQVLATRTDDVTIVLEDIYGTHNAAAVLRTADAFGLSTVHLVTRSVRSRVSRKVSQGAHKWLRIVHHQDALQAYADLRSRGTAVFAADIQPGAVDLAEVSVERPMALVFGNEHEGLSEAARDAADERFRVPMYGFVESLNISVACAVSVYDVLERRRRLGSMSHLDHGSQARFRAAWYSASVRAAPELLARAGLPEPLLCGEPLEVCDESR